MKGSLCRLAETSFLWRDTAMRIRERFNPRAPCGARLQCVSVFYYGGGYFNPRAPCGARPLGPKEKALIILISTHAPLAGRDSRFSERTIQHYISTHAPLAGRDAGTAQECRELAVFQPTRPLRGATGTIFYIFPQVSGFQPTRPLRGATSRRTNIEKTAAFQPTRPLRGATE